jgi:hypothetical protein
MRLNTPEVKGLMRGHRLQASHLLPRQWFQDGVADNSATSGQGARQTASSQVPASWVESSV